MTVANILQDTFFLNKLLTYLGENQISEIDDGSLKKNEVEIEAKQNPDKTISLL